MKLHQSLLCMCVAVTQLISADVPAFCLEGAVEAPVNEFRDEYTDVTKKIMLAGISLERFSLNYRKESVRQPKFRRLRYFLAQESAAGGELAFEITADEQFNRGRKRPLQISAGDLRGSLLGAMTTTIIGGAGSCLELSSNTLISVQNHKHGFSPQAANKFVAAKLREIDALLTQRDQIVRANSSSLAYNRAVLEGEILKELRNAFLDEYSHFHADSHGYATTTNMFYAINVAASAVGASGAGVAFHAIRNPHLNGTANALFIVAGAMDMFNPLLSSVAGKMARAHDRKNLHALLPGDDKFDYARLAAARAKLAETIHTDSGSLMPVLPAVDRLAIYGQSGDLFRKQIDNETALARHFNKVALQSCLFGPIVGGGIMTQGILGVTGYYKYPLRPRKQLGLFYAGGIVGTNAAAIATVGTAAQLLASYSYENHLRKRGMLPEQLIKARLEHLDELEKNITALK